VQHNGLVLLAVAVFAACSSSNVNDGANPAQGGTGSSTSGGSSGYGAVGGIAGARADGSAGGSGGVAGSASGGSAGSEPDAAAGAGGAAGGSACHGKDDPDPCKTSTASSCPAAGQEIKWLCIDPISGDAELQNTSDLRTYWCDLVFDKPDAFDCKTDLGPDFTQVITSISVGALCP
jgi:hypothetical protein